MKRQKVGLLVFLFLISSASAAFASIAIFWPVERHIQPAELLTTERVSFPIESTKPVQSDQTFNYQAWRQLQTSA